MILLLGETEGKEGHDARLTGLGGGGPGEVAVGGMVGEEDKTVEGR